MLNFILLFFYSTWQSTRKQSNRRDYVGKKAEEKIVEAKVRFKKGIYILLTYS